MKGLVIKSTGTSYGVYFEDGSTADCHVKGNFRIRGIRSTNPVAIGDYVEVTTNDDGTNWITELYDRKNYIIRRATNLSYASHILAANVDMAALIVTINHPKTSTTFIDRFLATCEAYRVPACLIFNKIDLLNEEELQELATLRQLYESLDYPTYAISALDLVSSSNSSIASSPLNGIFHNHVTLLSGNSGVGKSTLLNAILGKDIARTGAISSAHHKGMHTTTFSEMYPIEGLGVHECRSAGDDSEQSRSWIIDTPGIKGFGLLDVEKEEISHYFRDIFHVSRDCRYSNCLHTGEPGCAVYQAVANGEIALSRYESYLSILDDTQESKYR
jgi:ribosome biogenesis GTPase